LESGLGLFIPVTTLLLLLVLFDRYRDKVDDSAEAEDAGGDVVRAAAVFDGNFVFFWSSLKKQKIRIPKESMMGGERSKIPQTMTSRRKDSRQPTPCHFRYCYYHHHQKYYYYYYYYYCFVEFVGEEILPSNECPGRRAVLPSPLERPSRILLLLLAVVAVVP